MITISIFILFVLYMLGCIADGPDVKPILKRKISNYLRSKADYLYPAKYCDYFRCNEVHKVVELSRMLSIQNYHPSLHTIQETIMFDECDKFKAQQKAIDIYAEGKRICANKVLHSCIPYIRFDINDKNPEYALYIRATLLVGENNNYGRNRTY